MMNGLLSGYKEEAQEPVDNGQEESKEQQGKPLKLQKMVEAAQKLLYDETTAQMFMREMRGDPVQVAAETAVKVMLVLISEGKGTVDPSLVVPAGIVVVGDILDFVSQASGQKVEDQQTEEAMSLFVGRMMEAVTGKKQEEPEATDNPKEEAEDQEEQSEPVDNQQEESQEA